MVLNTDSPDWSKFETIDPFNGNLIAGKISHTSNDFYGALYIETVNSISVPQIILCTPKLHYPFGKSESEQKIFNFPKAVEVFKYLKLDGTNIFGYLYHDVDGKEFVSYKTRLLPFVQESKFGPFLSMWKSMLEKYPVIPHIIKNEGYNASFELWGGRNAHLIKYEIPLEASLLFFRERSTGRVVPPNVPGFMKDCNIVTAEFLGRLEKDYVSEYHKDQDELEKGLTETEDGYRGQEGEVWYLLDESRIWNLYKLKPETIEAIHWSAGGIGKNILAATIENAFESWETPTVENIKELLLEEFLAPEIEKVHYGIVRQLERAIENHKFVVEVLEKYKILGLSIITQKRETMQAMSSLYPKGQMSKVFSTIYNSAVK